MGEFEGLREVDDAESGGDRRAKGLARSRRCPRQGEPPGVCRQPLAGGLAEPQPRRSVRRATRPIKRFADATGAGEAVDQAT